MSAGNPVWTSWPNIRHASEEVLIHAGLLLKYQSSVNYLSSGHRPQGAQTLQGHELTYKKLQCWLDALFIDDDGQLVITNDSMCLLPHNLAYELLGPLILAAVDRFFNSSPLLQHQRQPHIACCKRVLQECHEAVASAAAAVAPQDNQQEGLRIVGLDLQEPVVVPLTTCMSAYSCLKQLSLKELNVDVSAAKRLGSIINSGSYSSSVGHSDGALGCSLLGVTLDSVFMCDMAWNAFCTGLAAGCALQELRLHRCLCNSSLAALAAALQSGCQQLRRLDVSYNSLVTELNSSTEEQHSKQAAVNADEAWQNMIEVLQNCPQLEGLTAVQCSLGNKAAASLARLLKSKDCRIKQLDISQCCAVGNAATGQLLTAAACCSALHQLDLSSTNLTDNELKPLCQASSWISRHSSNKLQHLRLGGNQLAKAAAAHIGRALAPGASLASLLSLSLAGCSMLADAGAIALATALSNASCSLKSLDLSGCELTDESVEALAGLIVPTAATPAAAASSHRSPLRSPLRWGAGGASPVAVQQCRLEELRLVDNQITAAGIKLLANAISNPLCALQLLDVSLNWVGPEGMKSLVHAEAALSAARSGISKIEDAPTSPGVCDIHQQQKQQQQLRRLTVLRECPPEYWRVEASKAAAAAASSGIPGASAVPCNHGTSFAAAAAASLPASSCCSGSCCSIAGTTVHDHLSDHTKQHAGTEAMPTALDDVKQQLWMFNTLYCTDAGLSRASSGIAAGVEACASASDICNHYAASDFSSECSMGTAGNSSNAAAVLSSDESASLEAAAPWLVSAVQSRLSLSSSQLSAATDGPLLVDKTAAIAPVSSYIMEAAAAATSHAPSYNECGGIAVDNVVCAESSSGSIADVPPNATSSCYQGWKGHQQLVLPAADQALHLLKAGARTPASTTLTPNTTSKCNSTGSSAADMVLSAKLVAAKKLVPQPPSQPTCRGSSASSAAGGKTAEWPAAPLVAPTPGLKTLRNMRRRVSEPAGTCSLKAAAAAAAAAGVSSRRVAGAQASGGVREGQPGMKPMHTSNSYHGHGGLGQHVLQQKQHHQIKAVASSSFGGAAVVNGEGTIQGSKVGSSDSCTLKDRVCNTRHRVLPGVSS